MLYIICLGIIYINVVLYVIVYTDECYIYSFGAKAWNYEQGFDL